MDSLQGGNRDDADAAGVEVRRAIEAMLMVALDPVPPNLLAQLLEVPTEEVERVGRGLAATYVDEGRGFSLARVAVSRGGAMATSEFLAWGIPSILVPLPTAAADHQSRNAAALSDAS